MSVSLTAKLHEAIKHGDDDVVQCCLDHGADVNTIYDRETACTLAIEYHRGAVASRIMHQATFSVNACNTSHRSPLFCAAKESFPGLVEDLIGMGADLNSRDTGGVSPMGATAFYNSFESAAILVTRGASVNERDTRRRSTLYTACSSVSLQVVDILLAHGADVNTATRHPPGCTPLMTSVPSLYEREVRHKRQTDMISIMRLLIMHGSDVNAVDCDGRIALHHAVETDELHAACLLVESGIDVEIADNQWLTAFHVALRPERPRYDVAAYLLLNGCNVNSPMTLSTRSNVKRLPLTVLLDSNPKQTVDVKLRKLLLPILLDCTNLCTENITELFQYFDPQGLVVVDGQDNSVSIPFALPASLQSLCRLGIHKSLGQKYLTKVKVLPIPIPIKQFLTFGYNFDPLKMAAVYTAIQDSDTDTFSALLKEVDLSVGNFTF
ncbi:poly [ADP-ribose] polymerase tankyrase-1-like [Gigantopelta aegis]|uniref:poly [ADP-ribose] polymerase tankyrase-1-like n=1 Tax=Gigantopelta aegis TaxID=1735272 RepID=UPI001B88A72E|nr:poly [ADP-ribose] polymerase tankyrase-1-like [Gigantopelta aegis]